MRTPYSALRNNLLGRILRQIGRRARFLTTHGTEADSFSSRKPQGRHVAFPSVEHAIRRHRKAPWIANVVVGSCEAPLTRAAAHLAGIPYPCDVCDEPPPNSARLKLQYFCDNKWKCLVLQKGLARCSELLSPLSAASPYSLGAPLRRMRLRLAPMRLLPPRKPHQMPIPLLSQSTPLS